MKESRYQAICDDLAARIRSGQLCPGTQLPTVRALMEQHGIALATAARVYRALEAVGLVVGEPGRGTYVRDTTLARGLGLQQHALHAAAVDLSFNYPSLPGQAEMLREGLRELAASGDLDALLHSAPQGGRPHERQSAAKHLRNRSIRVAAEQVLIVNGAQQGLATAVMALLRPGDVLAVDALTYPGMKALAAEHRLEVCPVPLLDGTTDLAALARLCKRRPVRAIYTMPTLHNPMGSVMSVKDRAQLAALADRHDFIIIEDGAYAFLAEPAPKPVFTLAPHRTVYVSGLSKSVASGLRIGFVAAPVGWIPALEQSIRVSTWNTPSITVALACRWIESGMVDDLEDAKRRDARTRQKLAQRILGNTLAAGPPPGKDGPLGGQRSTRSDKRGGNTLAAGPPQGKGGPLGGQRSTRSDKRGGNHCKPIAHPSSYFLWLPLPHEERAEGIVADLKRNDVLVNTAEPFATTPHVPHALRLAIGSVPMDLLEIALGKVRMAMGC